MRRIAVVVLVTGLACVAPVAHAASGSAFQEAAPARRQAGPAPGETSAGVTVAEAERLFDRYVLGQARVALQLAPDQMVVFAQRLERLQSLRRTRQRQRQRLLNELTQLSRAGGPADDPAVAARLEAFDASMAEADRGVQEARRRLEETLSVRQRARLRNFEARMEREKQELVARARAEARARAASAPGGE
jgi:hypothetical protein